MIEQTISHSIVESEKPIIRRRKLQRLKEYDYSLDGSYFVTICTKNREDLFGHIIGDTMQLKRDGKIVKECWEELPKHYPTIMLDEFVIMPNHVHGIIIIINDIVGARHASPLQRKHVSLGTIIGSFKSATTKRINEIRKTTSISIWQRNYYDHIIRNEKSLCRIREYIRTNPERWTCDKENPMFQGTDKFECWLNEEGKQNIKAQRIL
ncbi:MAG: transposase [Bacteroidota bacterium]|nr:transposase [Bacteroidota bacterium]